MKDKNITFTNPAMVSTSMTGPEARRGSATQISPLWGIAVVLAVIAGAVASNTGNKPATAGKKKSKKK